MDNNINQVAKKMVNYQSNSQETSSQWCSQACNQWARMDLAKRHMALPIWVEKASSQASLLPFKGKGVETLYLVSDHSTFREKDPQWFNTVPIIKKIKCPIISNKPVSWESTLKCPREMFSMFHLRKLVPLHPLPAIPATLILPSVMFLHQPSARIWSHQSLTYQPSNHSSSLKTNS